MTIYESHIEFSRAETMSRTTESYCLSWTGDREPPDQIIEDVIALSAERLKRPYHDDPAARRAISDRIFINAEAVK